MTLVGFEFRVSGAKSDSILDSSHFLNLSLSRNLIGQIQMMKLLLLLQTLAAVSACFVPADHGKTNVLGSLQMAYIPDGMSPEQWKKLKQSESSAKAKKKFGAYGPQSFKSRSLESFHKDLEKGKTGHLLPMFNAKEKLKTGKIKQQDIPYMQRGGSWDNSDVKGAQKRDWSSVDKKYNQNEKPFQFDWGGSKARKGPGATAAKAQKPKPNAKPAKKKLFGMF